MREEGGEPPVHSYHRRNRRRQLPALPWERRATEGVAGVGRAGAGCVEVPHARLLRNRYPHL